MHKGPEVGGNVDCLWTARLTGSESGRGTSSEVGGAVEGTPGCQLGEVQHSFQSEGVTLLLPCLPASESALPFPPFHQVTSSHSWAARAPASMHTVCSLCLECFLHTLATAYASQHSPHTPVAPHTLACEELSS